MECHYQGYQILQTIGEGTFGKVKLAKKNGQYYAIKFSSKSKAYSPELLQKIFSKECSIVSELTHPNITHLEESFKNGIYQKKGEKDEVRSGLVFEYMPYNLAEILQMGAFDQVIARTLFKMIIDGIGYLHSKNIIHRDIKPQNLLFDKHFNVKICDFGLSTKVDPQNKPKTICGSDSFKSPEMLLKKPYNGVMNDLFAAGVTLFILVLGRGPFINATPNTGYYQLIAMNYLDKFWKMHEKKKTISPELKDLIISMLAFDPTHRISLSQILCHPWMNQDILMGSDLQVELGKKRDQLMMRKKQMLEKLQNKGHKNYPQQAMNNRGEGEQKIIISKRPCTIHRISDRLIPKVHTFNELKSYFVNLDGQLVYESGKIKIIKMMEGDQKIVIEIIVEETQDADCLKFYLQEGDVVSYIELLQNLDYELSK